MEPPKLESKLPALLQRTVANMPLDANLEARMRRILEQNPTQSHRRPQIAAGVIVALIVLFTVTGYAWLKPHIGLGIAAQPSATTAENTASDKNITITIDAAYADASQTEIFYHLTSKVYSAAHLDGASIDAVVTDAKQHEYQNFDISGSSQQVEVQSNYTPLVPSLLQGTQNLTLMVHDVQLLNLPSLTPETILGSWRILFTVTPLIPHTNVFNVSPITHSGVTVQPISLEVFSGQHPFANNGSEGSGARLILRISGLLTPEALSDASQFSVFVKFPDGSAWTGETGSHLTLNATVPAFTTLLPGSEQGDTEEVEILYLLPLHLTGSSALLSIDQISISGSSTFAIGPWSFDLPVA